MVQENADAAAGTSHSNRPLADITFLGLANLWRERSTCERGHVGCVIASPDGYVLTSGYNGAPRGMPHCTDVGCMMDDSHCVRAIHAEMNAVIQAARQGVSIVGASLYITKRPCLRCTTVLIQAGIREIVYVEDYFTDNGELAREWCLQAGIKVRRGKW